ncbi:MAG: hypothetical protein COA88_11150 [Kordia sp.]|nr:MAG: hypothetical protein COA88_11150 [Kordia sp.]
MKKNLIILLAIFFFQSCSEAPTYNASINMIKKVETGLTTPVYIEEDSIWTIKERMEYYGALM